MILSGVVESHVSVTLKPLKGDLFAYLFSEFPIKMRVNTLGASWGFTFSFWNSLMSQRRRLSHLRFLHFT